MAGMIGFISSRAMNTLFYFMNIFMGMKVTGLAQAIKQDMDLAGCAANK